MKNRTYAICSAALLATILSGTYEPANLGNGWYTNLPPVTEAALSPVIGCLVANGAPPSPTLFANPVFDWGDGRTQTPTMLRWMRNGKVWEGDAVFTYYSPPVAYYDVMKATGTPPSPSTIAEFNSCIKQLRSPTVITVRKNPLGLKQSPEWCIDKPKVAECWQGNVDDQFTPGEEFMSPDGTYRKVRGGFFVLTWSCWVKVDALVASRNLRESAKRAR